MALLVIVAVVGAVIGVVWVSGPSLVDAQQPVPTATRSFSSTTVPAGGELMVTIAVSDNGGFGKVSETLPAGFTYLSSSSNVEGDTEIIEGVQTVGFIILGNPEFTYTVTASDREGTYRFSGILETLNPAGENQVLSVEGATNVTVGAAAAATADRSFSLASVATGEEVEVTIEVSRYGASGTVVETLPGGFAYLSSSLGEAAVADGQAVTFTLPAEGEEATSFTYTVTASDMAGDHTFMGVLTDEDGMTADVGGTTVVTVTAVEPTPTHSASRSFEPASVASGGEVVVTIAVSGYGAFGEVKETLPAGFTYVSSSLDDDAVVESGQTVTFRLIGETEFTYTITAAGAAGTHPFTGVAFNEDFLQQAVGGATTVTVEAAAPPPGFSANRSFAPASVASGGEVVVTIAVSGYGAFGEVKETLPAGFTYVSSSLDDDAVVESGQMVTFRLIGETEFTYTVIAASAAGPHSFLGVALNEDFLEAPVGGVTSVTVETAAPPPGFSANRSFAPASVASGDEVVVTIAVSGYGAFGEVKETLPAGFTYVSSSLDDDAVVESGQTVTFRLIGESSFTYTVMAASAAGTHSFMGVALNEDFLQQTVGGDTTVTVEAAAPPAGFSASRSFAPASVASGGEVVVTIAVSGYGAFGEVKETLPAGFTYVSSSLDDDAVVESGQTVTFRLIGETEFTYTVTAPDRDARFTFRGVALNEDFQERGIGGDSRITVGSPAPPRVTPTPTPTPAPTRMSPPPRRRGGGGGGIPALPAGTVAAGVTVSSPAPSETVPAQARVRTPNAGVVRIAIAPGKATTLVQGLNMAGTVFDITAPQASVEEPLELIFLVRTQTASGDLIVLKDGVMVGDCRGASGQASPDPCVSSRGKAGTTVVVKVLTSEDGVWEFRSPTLAAAPKPVPTVAAPTPKPTVAPTMRPTPEPTVAPTPEPTVAPTMRPTPTPTVAVVLPRPRPTPVATVPAAPVPTATTAVPPTPVPTATPTTAPVAVMVAPEPSPTAMPEPTVTTAPVAPPAVEEDGGFPLWLIVVIIVGAIAVLVGGGFAILRARGG